MYIFSPVLNTVTLLGTFLSQLERYQVLVYHAGQVRFSRPNIPSRNLWSTLRYAGFLTIFSFTTTV